MMNVQELGTLRRAKLPVKMVLMDNQRLGMVRQWQELFFDARFSETILSDNPDFVRLASAFDIAGETITRKEEVPAAIAQNAGQPRAPTCCMFPFQQKKMFGLWFRQVPQSGYDGEQTMKQHQLNLITGSRPEVLERAAGGASPWLCSVSVKWKLYPIAVPAYCRDRGE